MFRGILQVRIVAMADDESQETSANSGPATEALRQQARALSVERRFSEAAELLRKAVALHPDDVPTLCDLGNTLVNAKHTEEGVRVLQQAIHLAPAEARLYSNLGLALTELGRFDEAEVAFFEALTVEPTLTLAHNNLGQLYIMWGRHQEAIDSLDLALALDPNYAKARKNRALACLSLGDFARGWVDYDWCAFGVAQRVYPQPLWQGEPLAGKHILLTAQQGLGDTLQFVRYAQQLREQAARVTLEVPLPLAHVLKATQGIDEIVVQGEKLPATDVCVPLMALPRIFQTSLKTIPAKTPYLTAEPERVARWRKRLAVMTSPGDFLIGIAWQGNPHHQWDQFRSVPLMAFAKLAQMRGIRLVSLQRGPGVEQIEACKQVMGQSLVAPTDGQQTNAEHLADTAALMMLMDLVVTVDTATAHLAGALGRRVWVALAVACDWRWLTQRQDSPWYPTMRLFRQNKIKQWDAVFEAMAQELAVIPK